MSTKRSLSAVVIGFCLICISLINIGCTTKIDHKIAIEQRVSRMYEGYTDNPEKALVDRFNDWAESGSQTSLNSFKKAANRDIEFNIKCVEFISNDSILQVYFEGFIDRHFGDTININNLNYYSIPVRQQLQKELDVKLIK